MGIFDAIHTGLSELLSHKMRSILTMLGVIFGVAAVIAMVSIGEGAKQEALLQIREMGVDVIMVKRAVISGELLEKAETDSPFGLKYSDAAAVKEICDFAKRVVPLREVFANVKKGEKPLQVKVVGTTDGYDDVARLRLQQGRFLNSKDITQRRAVCVLGVDAKRDLFGFSNPIGQMAKIENRMFRVVGVLDFKEKGSSSVFSAMRDANRDIYIPITLSISDYQIYSQQAVPSTMRTLRELFQKLMSRISTDKSPISEIVVQASGEEATEPTADVLNRVLKRSHKGIKDYEMVIPAQLLRQSQQTQRIFNVVMAAIAGISLLVGGIGIMNIMLATVSQRTREIGIRRCIGATRWDIIRQFMLEALVITCVGGLIGIGLGVGGAKAISVYAKWLTVVSTQAIVVSFGVSVIVGVVFGMYPAIRAAMVDPIEALREG